MSTTIALSMAKTLGALLIVLLCFFVLAKFLQRLQTGGRGNSDQMRVVSAMAVGNRERVVLIEAQGKTIMLGVAAGRVSPIHVFDEKDSSFSQQLKQAEQA
ncbi:MAG: flagellar biosynthetic protein FliO [Salinisphaeraceae bacterium]|nr:flagellar biosynthetic protein FliO [Salinisphaeraceae bacterium]